LAKPGFQSRSQKYFQFEEEKDDLDEGSRGGGTGTGGGGSAAVKNHNREIGRISEKVIGEENA